MTVDSSVYPTEDEKVAISAAEELMRKTMARYDCSHDAYHGMSPSFRCLSYVPFFAVLSARHQGLDAMTDILLFNYLQVRVCRSLREDTLSHVIFL